MSGVVLHGICKPFLVLIHYSLSGSGAAFCEAETAEDL